MSRNATRIGRWEISALLTGWLVVFCADGLRGEEIRAKVVQVKGTIARVDVPESKRWKAGDQVALYRDGRKVGFVAITAVKPAYLVCQGQAIVPHVDDEVRLPVAAEKSASADDKEAGQAEPGGESPAASAEGRTSGVKDSKRVDGDAISTPRKTRKQILAEIQAIKEAEAQKRWLALLETHGIEPWPVLSEKEHAAAIEEHKKFTEKVGAVFPGMKLHETENFLFFTNIPQDQVGPYVSSLDAMHLMMCQMYNIAPKTRVWRGKALVVAFLHQEEFIQFEARFQQTSIGAGIYGLCHQRSDGAVVIGCFRGDRTAEFGQMLVHETSHGFIHRYKTPVHFPNWVNEGMADWVGAALVPASKSVKAAEARALEIMRQTRSLGGDFFTRRNIDAWQYGVASSLADFMIRTNKAAYIEFIEGMKAGMTWEESLRTAYKSSPEQLISAYGRAIGVPDLRP